MHIKIFTLKFNPLQDGFETSEFQNFIKDKNVISVRDYMFQKNDVSYLILIVKYYSSDSLGLLKTAQKSSNDQSWKKMLTDSDMGFFNTLREWRTERSKKEGVPPYILFNNNQLAQIVKSRPQTKADLLRIDGVGSAKVEKYGEAILAISKIDIGEH